MVVLLLVSVVAYAQGDAKKVSDQEFFLGKWILNVQGLPTGDAEMLLVINQDADGNLSGTIGDKEGAQPIKLANVSIEEGTITVNFNGSGYDVPVYLDRKDDGTVEGAMNDMFDITGHRLEEQPK